MKISIIFRNIFDFSRALAAALLASMAMSVSIALLAAFANPGPGLAVFVLAATTYLPLAVIGSAPTAVGFVVIGLWLRQSAMRFLVLLLTGIASGAAAGALLSTQLLSPSQPSSGLFWLVVLGATGGVIGACVFAYLTPKRDLPLNSGQ